MNRFLLFFLLLLLACNDHSTGRKKPVIPNADQPATAAEKDKSNNGNSTTHPQDNTTGPETGTDTSSNGNSLPEGNPGHAVPPQDGGPLPVNPSDKIDLNDTAMESSPNGISSGRRPGPNAVLTASGKNALQDTAMEKRSNLSGNQKLKVDKPKDVLKNRN